MSVRVVLAEDDYLVLEGVQRLLEHGDGIEVVAGYPDAASVLDHLDEDKPDVVITDIRMPPSWEAEGLRLARDLRARDPRIAVIVLSQFASPENAAEIFADGTERRAYVLKERITDRAGLVRVIEEVADGGSYVDAELVAALVHAREKAPSPLDELTEREREVLALVAEGLTNGAIAKRLYLSKRSVEGNINSIFRKLDLSEETDVSRRVTVALVFLAATS